MNDLLILSTPLMVLVVLAAFGFAGCGKVLPPAEDPEPEKQPEKPSDPTPPGPGTPPPPTPTPPLPAAKAYEEAVKNTTGFAALWPLNETGGNVANVVGLSSNSNGSYITPSGIPNTGYKLGGPQANGAFSAKDQNDFAPEFDGSEAYVEVSFAGQLNPSGAAFTVELWVNPATAAGLGEQVLISSHRFDSAGNQQGYEITLERHGTPASKEIHGRVFSGGVPSETSQLLLDQDSPGWLYIVFIYNPVAVNGETTLLVRVATLKTEYKSGPNAAIYANVSPANQATLRFAAGHAIGQAATGFFNGRIDNVAFYNAALAQGPGGDIEKHFNFF